MRRLVNHAHFQAAVALAVCVAVAGWLDFAHLHRYLTPDGLVPVLIGMWRWRPYYWSQSRYGMLWPLFALPWRTPLTTLLVVQGLSALGGLAACFALARTWLGREGPWCLAGTLSIALLLAALPPFAISETLGAAQFFSTPLALGLVGLTVARERRGAAASGLAFGLLALAAWVNWAAPVLLGSVAFARPAFWAAIRDGGRRGRACPSWRELAALTAGGIVGQIGRAVGGSDQLASHWVSGGRWLASLLALTGNLFDALGGTRAGWRVPLAAMAAALLVAVTARLRPMARPALVRAVMPVIAGAGGSVAYVVAIAGQQWTLANASAFRYALPTLQVLIGCVGAAAGAALATLCPRTWRGAMPAAALLALLAAHQRFGPPSLAGVRRDLDDTFGRHTDAVLAAGATHVAGPYGEIWPAAFHATYRLHAQGRPANVFGIGTRMAPTRKLWDADPASWRIAILQPPADPEALAALLGVPALAEVPNTGALTVLRPVAPAAAPPAAPPPPRRAW